MGALAEAVKAKKDKKLPEGTVNVNANMPKRRGNPNLGQIRKNQVGEKKPKLTPDGREIPEGYSYKKKTGEITPITKREKAVERRAPDVILAELEAKKQDILDRAASAVAKLDQRIEKLNGKYEDQVKLAEEFKSGKTAEQIEAEIAENMSKLKSLRKTLKRHAS